MVKIPTHRTPTHPGEMLLEKFLKPMGISQKRLSDAINIPYQRINKIINQKKGITPDTALRLAKYFGVSEDFWLNIQLRWDLFIARAMFESKLQELLMTFRDYVSTEDGQWTVKGFIDIFKNIYTISSDTKIVSKVLEIHLFPKILAFAEQHGFALVLADHQNYYPDISFVLKKDESVRFAVDFKTTYRIPDKPWLCNGFTLGSHGKYFQDRTSKKNIQFPYDSYMGHFCLGIIYDRTVSDKIDETRFHSIEELQSISSVISNIQFFVAEKWKIAGDKGGSGNTANIGSIQRIEDILAGNGMFSRLGEDWFDDYWMNFGKITVKGRNGKIGKITSLADFVKYRGGDESLIVARNNYNQDKQK